MSFSLWHYVTSVAAYVEQYDTLLGTLTVREMLMYQSELKGDPDEPADERVAFVDGLIEDLKLSSCKHVIVGDVLSRRISVGRCTNKCNSVYPTIESAWFHPSNLFITGNVSSLCFRTHVAR